MSVEKMVQGRVDGIQGLDPLVQVGLEVVDGVEVNE